MFNVRCHYGDAGLNYMAMMCGERCTGTPSH